MDNRQSVSSKDCRYNITVAHKREDARNSMFVCGTNIGGTLCCDLNLSESSLECIPSHNTSDINKNIKEFILKEDEPSVLVESAKDADLYIAYSGSQDHVGIHKFGKNRVGPSNHDKEQHYVGLVLSRRRDKPLQDKVYAFYKEKNRDTGLDSEMWLPFVTQICTADVGGPKNYMQFSWTSQMNARLYCGDSYRKQYFPELVDVAFTHGDKWPDTRVYALFRNEWGMSAVCVYTIQEIDHIFRNTTFKDSWEDRSRECVEDSTKISLETLKKIKTTSEMEELVQPEGKSGPLLFNHHNYTHIYVGSQHKNNLHPVLFLSLNNGGIHKVVQNKSQSFIISEYRPFDDRGHILSITLNPSSRRLYVNFRSEMVQLNLANCAQYGQTCEDCILARDPDCGWDGTHCAPQTDNTLQDVAAGDPAICKAQSSEKVLKTLTDTHEEKVKDSITVPFQSKYFLQCPVSSHHAQYTWHHPKGPTHCSTKEQHCTLFIHSMGPEQVGTYRCVSEEKGYEKVLAEHQLKLGSGAACHSSSLLVWVSLLVVLMKSLSC
ncbi:hypothetical protein L3Q82_008822 [Scortum barcoo]|uniref:Uncharacterized protein n=1 Tax=Scortum barcoo TaxID=214431 RepID=A0ACB8XFS7_9TELE|nr:hypothetical protein L3Q82_008822 [Scortum barcoo]